MHNGSLETLMDVVHFYNNGGGGNQSAGLEPLNLTDSEMRHLVAFLESLSSETPPVAVPELPAYGLLALGDATEPVAVSADVSAAEPAEEIASDSAPSDAESGTESDATADSETVAVTDELVAAITKSTCGACHIIPDIPGAVGQVGPDLSNIGAEGATRVEGLSAVEYIQQSIMEPNAVIAPECPTGACLPNLMPVTLIEMLTEDELTLIIDYLASLRGGQ